MTKRTILITGAGSGFGRETALRLAGMGHDVIAGVEIVAQIDGLEREARERGVTLRVEKLDVTDPVDHQLAWQWDVDVLLNNAGISEGGAMADIPAERLRQQFEVNVFGPMLLTQGFARQMVQRGTGRIVFMSSVAGLTVDPFTGAYSGSKHAVEAFAEALYKELKTSGVEVATINPGPFLTGFNDRMFETPRRWHDEPSERVFDYERLSFPHQQFDPEPVIAKTLSVLLEENAAYRNVVPESLVEQTKSQHAGIWQRCIKDGCGERHELVQAAYDMRPATPVDER